MSVALALMALEELAGQYRQLHRDPEVFRGLSVLAHAGDIRKLIVETGAETLLDYGCGKGAQYRPPYQVQSWWGVTPTLFDPGVPEYSKRPADEKVFDGVICSDVLEHIPRRKLTIVLDDIFDFAGKFIFLTACPRKANRLLPNGMNCHLTVESAEWWQDVVKTRMKVRDTEKRGIRVEFRITP